MLSRTADNLYWLARYVERAEFLARIIDATSRLATLPKAYGGVRHGMGKRAARRRRAGGLQAALRRRRRADGAAQFLAFDENNPSSIRICFERARSNARAVRTALTADMWEAINGAWIEMRNIERAVAHLRAHEPRAQFARPGMR